MIEQYKLIAHFHGVGYQPLMRDVMARFVPGALREILESEKVKAEKAVVEMPHSSKLRDARRAKRAGVKNPLGAGFAWGQDVFRAWGRGSWCMALANMAIISSMSCRRAPTHRPLAQ